MNNKIKNIIGIIGLGVLMTSCVSWSYTTTTITTTMYGDVSLHNDNGEVIREWNNSVIQGERDEITNYYESINGESHWTGISHETTSTFKCLKNSGLNFIDESGKAHYISGGIIIVDNLTSKSDTLVTTHKSKNWDKENTSETYNPYAIYAEKEKARKEKKEAVDPYDQDHQP